MNKHLKNSFGDRFLVLGQNNKVGHDYGKDLDELIKSSFLNSN